MNWRIRRFTSILVILTITIIEYVLSYPDLDQAIPFDAEGDAGETLYLTPLIAASDISTARSEARVQLPGTDNPSYAGFLTVDEETDKNLFFWFIPALVDTNDAPVIAYLEGGPGRTLFFNLFLQHGSLVSASTWDELSILDSTWNEKYNMIYIDSPAGTGFSFMNRSAAYHTNQIHIARDLLKALEQFFTMCPEFRGNDFYVAGESMAGKLVPALTSDIHWYNKNASQEDKINLKGMIIGNGFMDPENQLAYGKYIHAMGLVDGKTASQLETLETRAQALIHQNNHLGAYDVVSSLFALLRQKIGYCSAYNIHQPVLQIEPYNFIPWVKRSDVRKALHVGNKLFTALSYKTMESLRRDMTRSSANMFGQMLQHYRALVYTGNLGIACPYSSVHQSLLEVTWGGKEQFRAAQKRQWLFSDPYSTVLAGYVRNYSNLYEVLVRNAGHFPSMDHPEWLLDLLDKFTKGSL